MRRQPTGRPLRRSTISRRVAAARMTEAEIDRFDRLAARRGFNRSDYIRWLVAQDDQRQREERNRDRNAA